MAAEYWRKIKEVFESPLDLPSASPASMLDRTGAAPDLNPLPGDPVAQPAFSLKAGDLVAGRYAITGMIGRGGMGEVYEAQDQLLDEKVALKTLRADLSRNDAYIRRFQKEIQLARKVTHPNVCRVFEVGVHQDSTGGPPLRFFTMELLRGETLSARIRRVQRLPRGEAFRLAVQMAEGLQAAHEVGIVHTDFKSGNVIVTQGPGGERAVITDFGLARNDPDALVPEETRTMSVVGHVVGTVAYMSPEQLTGGTITTASDIYSFGIVLFEMATGQLPFDDKRVINSAVQRVSGDGISARALVPDIDPRWDSAIAKCLQKEPEHRFSSASAIADWFRGGAWRMPRLSLSRRDWIRVAAALIVVLMAGSGLIMWARRPYQPQPAALDWYRKGVEALNSMTYETARKFLEQSVSSDPAFALAHASLARAYQELDFYDLATASMLRAVRLAQETRLSAADQRKMRALDLLVSREYDRAVPLFQELEAAANKQDKAAAALETGWLAQQREKIDEAAAAYERAVKLVPGYAAAKLRLGYIIGRRGQKDDLALALKTLTEAENLYRTSSDYEGVTETLLQRAILLNVRSRWNDALPVIEQAYAVARPVGNTSQLIRLQLLEGVVARNLGQTGRASDLARQAIEAAQAQKMENVATSGLIDLGNSFLAGDPETAERYYRQALEFAQRNKGRRNQARAQFQLASLFEQSKPEEARKFIELALPFYKEGGYQRELILASAVLGGIDQNQAEFDAGIRILSAVLPLAVQLGDRQTEAFVRQRLGSNLRDQGNWPKALEEFERAAGLLKLPGIGLQLDRAEMYRRLGRGQDAARALSEVQEALDRSPNQRLQNLWLKTGQSEMAYANGRLSDAKTLAQQALSLTPGNGGSEELSATLIQALAMIRSGQERRGVDLAKEVIERFNQGKLIHGAASGRLSTAEALFLSGNRGLALTMAQEALGFFEPREIWESIWRGHLIAARASTKPADAEAHLTSARAALARLKGLWPPGSVDNYLQRPDIKLLSGNMKF
jgi:serine/threonine protein kinase/tetratricopeptide (TPR) repeat protein